MNSEVFVHLFHIIFVGGLFLYVGINGTTINPIMYPFLFYLGIIVILYHSYKIYAKLLKGSSIWVNLLHVFIFGPLMILIGYYGKETSRKYFELLIMCGMAAIGYHGYYLLINI